MTVKDVLTKLIIFYVGDRRGGRIVMVRKGKVKGWSFDLRLNVKVRLKLRL